MTNTADQSADDDDDTDFWLAIPGFRESLIEAGADYAAGRTFREHPSLKPPLAEALD